MSSSRVAEIVGAPLPGRRRNSATQPTFSVPWYQHDLAVGFDFDAAGVADVLSHRPTPGEVAGWHENRMPFAMRSPLSCVRSARASQLRHARGPRLRVNNNSRGSSQQTRKGYKEIVNQVATLFGATREKLDEC
jgi:hypothetical protein